MTSRASDNSSVRKMAFDYAWNYFSLHSGQRLQSVNFFIIAAAFLAGAYVTATVGGRPGLAIGLSIVGAFSSLIFYRIERRIRELIHAAEAALRPIEKAMASQTEIPNLLILEKVEAVTPGAWHYSKVFRTLYITVGLAFAVAAIYAIRVKLGAIPNVTNLPATIRLLSGLVLLAFAYVNFVLASRRGNTDYKWLDKLARLTLLAAGALTGLGGAYVLFRLGVWG